jgi:hypothetical protein
MAATPVATSEVSSVGLPRHYATWQEGKTMARRDCGNQAGATVVLAADTRLAVDSGKELFNTRG